MDEIAAFVKKHFKGTLLGDGMINFLRLRGIDERLYFWQMRKQYAKDVLLPPDEVIEAKRFFKTHKEQIKNILHYLEDEESKECFRRCIKYRCTHNMKYAPKYTKHRYFVKDIVIIRKGEVLIDGGAFVGDTVRDFVKMGRNYKKVIAFEPDEYNYAMLSKLKYRNVIKINKGLWDQNGKLSFSNGGGCGSRMVDGTGTFVEVVKLDDVPQCADATFIKLDVEGAELNALKGAEQIIRRNHPKLAICIYHKNEDMLDIIDYIHEIEPKYHIYVRHHSRFVGETVMYAIYK